MEINFGKPFQKLLQSRPTTAAKSTRINSARTNNTAVPTSTTTLLLNSARTEQTKHLRSISNFLYKEYVTNKSLTESTGVCLNS